LAGMVSVWTGGILREPPTFPRRAPPLHTTDVFSDYFAASEPFRRRVTEEVDAEVDRLRALAVRG